MKYLHLILQYYEHKYIIFGTSVLDTFYESDYMLTPYRNVIELD